MKLKCAICEGDGKPSQVVGMTIVQHYEDAHPLEYDRIQREWISIQRQRKQSRGNYTQNGSFTN